MTSWKVVWYVIRGEMQGALIFAVFGNCRSFQFNCFNSGHFEIQDGN